MIPISEFGPRLHSQGFRVTAQRMAILGALSRSSTHLTPVQVHERARRESPSLTSTTVYRTLQQLARHGLVWPLRLENNHLAYELAGRNHHHLVCSSCGDEVEFAAVTFDLVYTNLETSSGFVLDRDHLTLTGLCPKCQRRRKRKVA